MGIRERFFTISGQGLEEAPLGNGQSPKLLIFKEGTLSDIEFEFCVVLWEPGVGLCDHCEFFPTQDIV